MGRNFALVGTGQRGARPMACLGFVILLSLAFWAGALWIAEFLFRLSSLGY